MGELLVDAAASTNNSPILKHNLPHRRICKIA
jgi:hypothetical protein